MSGGKFGYDQRRIQYIIEEIKEVIEKNGQKREKRDSWDSEYYYNFPEDIIEELKKGIEHLKVAYIYAQRIDWLLCDDDGIESFRRRLKSDLEELKDH